MKILHPPVKAREKLDELPAQVRKTEKSKKPP